FVVERGMLPQVTAQLPEKWGGHFELRLLGMGGIVIGMMTAEIAGLCAAVCAAMLLGLSQSPGYLGASLVSFSISAWFAGKLAHHYRFSTILFSAFWIFLLLICERALWTLVRFFFFRNTALNLAWTEVAALAYTSILGGMIVAVIAPRLRRPIFSP